MRSMPVPALVALLLALGAGACTSTGAAGGGGGPAADVTTTATVDPATASTPTTSATATTAGPPGPGPATGGPTVPGDAAGPYPLVAVVDGDTIRVAVDGRETTLRLIGIDTPETDDPRRPVECFGREASAQAEQLLGGRPVRLSYDASQGRLDRYGRTLAFVWLESGESLQWRLLHDGFAAEYTYDDPYRYLTEFTAAEADASVHGRGLWAAATCGGDLDEPAAPPAEQPPPAIPGGDAGPPGGFASCDAARAAGAAPVHAGQPGYRSGLDGDGDGIACEVT